VAERNAVRGRFVVPMLAGASPAGHSWGQRSVPRGETRARRIQSATRSALFRLRASFTYLVR